MEYAGLPLGLWYALIVLVVLGILGVIGNVVAIVFYAKHGADTSTTVFIMALSWVDLFLSSIVMLVDVYGVISGFYNKTTIACKTTFYFLKSVFLVSFMLLILIGADRFRKICQPFSKQFTKAQSKWVSFIAGMFGAVLSSPIAFTANLQTIKNSTSDHCSYNQTDQNVICQCMPTETGVLGTVYLVSSSLDVICFIFILSSICITYTCVIVQIRRQTLLKRRRMMYRGESGSQTTDHAKRGQQVTSTELTLTVMSCCNTITFIACLIPYFVVELGGFRQTMDDFVNNAWMEILYRSPYLGSTLYPYIVCFFNPRFRQLVKRMLIKETPGQIDD